MKKLIVVFVLLCSGVIYFIGSACTGEDGCGEEEDITEIEGPTLDDCSTVPVPVADFTPTKTEYLVGEMVTYTFTGTLGVIPSEDDLISYMWDLPGSHSYGTDWGGSGPFSVYYSAPGIYSASVRVYNGCYWSNKKIKIIYITIKAPGGE